MSTFSTMAANFLIEYSNGDKEITTHYCNNINDYEVNRLIQSKNFRNKGRVSKVILLSALSRCDAKYDIIEIIAVDNNNNFHKFGLDLKVPLTEFEAIKRIEQTNNIIIDTWKSTRLEADGIDYVNSIYNYKMKPAVMYPK